MLVVNTSHGEVMAYHGCQSTSLDEVQDQLKELQARHGDGAKVHSMRRDLVSAGKSHCCHHVCCVTCCVAANLVDAGRTGRQTRSQSITTVHQACTNCLLVIMTQH